MKPVHPTPMAGKSDQKGATLADKAADKHADLDETLPSSAKDALSLVTEKLPEIDPPVPEDIAEKPDDAVENSAAKTAISEPLPDQAALDSAADFISVEFLVATKSEGLEATIMLEAPAGFDPMSPDFDLFFEEVMAEAAKMKADFPDEVTNIDPITAVTGVKVTLPDGTTFSQPAPFASDDMEYLFTTEAVDETLPEAEDDTDDDSFELI